MPIFQTLKRGKKNQRIHFVDELVDEVACLSNNLLSAVSYAWIPSLWNESRKAGESFHHQHPPLRLPGHGQVEKLQLGLESAMEGTGWKKSKNNKIQSSKDWYPWATQLCLGACSSLCNYIRPFSEVAATATATTVAKDSAKDALTLMRWWHDDQA